MEYLGHDPQDLLNDLINVENLSYKLKSFCIMQM